MNAVKEIVAFVFKALREGLTFLSYANVVLGYAKIFFSGLQERVEKLVDQEDEILQSLPPSLSEQALEMNKLASFKRVVDTTHANFAGAVPKGIIKSVAEVVIYKKNHPTDERNTIARSKGFIKVYDEAEVDEALKDVVENGLNQGWGHGK